MELLGQPAPCSEVGGLAGEVRLRAGAEAGAERGVDGEALGQSDDCLLDGGAGDAAGVEDAAAVVDGEVEGEAGARCSGVGHQLDFGGGQGFVAFFHRLDRLLGARGGALPGRGGGGEDEAGAAGGGGHGEEALDRFGRRFDGAVGETFAPGAAGLLVEAVAALFVVGALPGRAPDLEVQRAQVEGLGHLAEDEVEAVVGFAQVAVDEDRGAEGREADGGGVAEAVREVEEAEVAHGPPHVDAGEADLGGVGAALAGGASFVG